MSRVVFTPNHRAQQLIAQEIHSSDEFKACTAQYASQSWTYAKLRLDVKEEKTKARISQSSNSPMSSAVPSGSSTINVGGTVPVSSSRGIADKQEIKLLLDKFLFNFGNIMASTFGDATDRADTSTPTLTARPVPEPPIEQQKQHVNSGAVHHGIVCDVCNTTIVGVRYKCLDCLDYDLCQGCMVDRSTSHPIHEFHKITTPGRVIVHTVGEPRERKTHNASCDMCDSRIRGDRYKCTNCPDFDVCHSCFAIVPQQHPTHIFVKISNPQDIMPGLPEEYKTAHSARCNACDSMIYGVRYKCLMCVDFDLCMHCEALPISVHPGTHVFCKIKSDTITAAHPLFQGLSTGYSVNMEKSSSEIEISQKVEDQLLFSASESQAEPIDFQTEKVLPEIPRTPLLSESTAKLMAPTNTPKSDVPLLKATFLTDNNMPDGQLIAPGAEFVKSWRLLNDGTRAWPDNTAVVFIAGNRLAAYETAPTRYKVGQVLPGEAVDVWAGDMKAPDEPGRYVSYWSLQDENGCLFGHRVWCDIVVPEIETSTLHHSGSVTLPTLRGDPEISLHPDAVPASLPRVPSLVTDHTSLPSHTTSNSVSLDSKDWEEWEEAETHLAPRADLNHEGPAAIPGSAEWVLLSD